MEKKTIIWFRNDLRIRDNEAIYRAIQESDTVIPVYCFDPRQFTKTDNFGFSKIGKFRVQFLIECVRDLKMRLYEMGANLLIRYGKPEDIVCQIAQKYKVKNIYCHEEVCSEEVYVETELQHNLKQIGAQIHFFWGSTLYHFDDLPMKIELLPDIFTDFRKRVEKLSNIRSCLPTPEYLNAPLDIEPEEWGEMPTLETLNKALNTSYQAHNSKPLYKGGETEALLRLKHYFWETNSLKTYKETRNQLLGLDYSSKFSPYLAHGVLSPRTIHKEVQKYERERTQNESTYWLIFELIWRDYFRFVAAKYDTAIFKEHGPKNKQLKNAKNLTQFSKWAKGETGIPFIDANMKELNNTGFMSNRGRQNVASFLVKDMNIDWRMGAEYFESLLIDYDPCSNYGNWNYVAGIGNDPRENRYFNVLTQAKKYDQFGEYVKHWLPELAGLPSSHIHEPYLLEKSQQAYLNVNIGKDYPKPCINIHNWKARRR